jgi:hypothetical protein
VTLKAVVCVPLGHRWEVRPDSDETYPVLRCRRCGRLTELAPGTGGGERLTERAGRASMMRGMFDVGRRR